jgi:hypothetical protein
MDDIKTLESLGFSLPSPAYLAGSLLFSLLGYLAYRYGKRNALALTKWLGVALMLFPYGVSDTRLLYIVGAGLCLAAWFASRPEH